MAEPFAELAGLDKLIHEPSRLAILTALSACESADFLYLQRLTGLTTGNLSSHLSRLDEAGMVAIEKHFVDRRPNTRVSLSEKGRAAIERYWQRMEALRQETTSWEPSPDRDE